MKNHAEMLDALQAGYKLIETSGAVLDVTDGIIFGELSPDSDLPVRMSPSDIDRLWPEYWRIVDP